MIGLFKTIFSRKPLFPGFLAVKTSQEVVSRFVFRGSLFVVVGYFILALLRMYIFSHNVCHLKKKKPKKKKPKTKKKKIGVMCIYVF